MTSIVIAVSIDYIGKVPSGEGKKLERLVEPLIDLGPRQDHSTIGQVLHRLCSMIEISD